LTFSVHITNHPNMVEYRSYQDILPIIPSSNNTTLNAAYSQDTSLSQELQDTSLSQELQDTSLSQELQDISLSQELQDTSLSQELQDTSLSHELHYCSYIIAHRQKKM
jgi:hypothetical protein